MGRGGRWQQLPLLQGARPSVLSPPYRCDAASCLSKLLCHHRHHESGQKKAVCSLGREGKVLMLIIRHLRGTAHSVLVVLNQRDGRAYVVGGPGSRLLLVWVSGPQSQSRARVRSPEGLSGCHRWPGNHSTVSPSREQIHPRATPKGFALPAVNGSFEQRPEAMPLRLTSRFWTSLVGRPWGREVPFRAPHHWCSL